MPPGQYETLLKRGRAPNHESHLLETLEDGCWTLQKCRTCARALRNGLPLKNAFGRARLPYQGSLQYLQQGEKDLDAFYAARDPEAKMTLAAHFYLDVQEAIATRIERRLKLYDKNADGADYVKNWQREVELLKRLDPDTWNVATRNPTTIINNSNQQANVEASAVPAIVEGAQGVRFLVSEKDGEQWKQGHKGRPLLIEEDRDLDHAA